MAESPLVRRSGLLFVSNVVAKLLAFGFTVVAARALHPSGLGVVTYVLTLANFGSILLFNASNGLARDLVRAEHDPEEETAAFSNYAVVVSFLLALSLVGAVPLGLLVGLHGWLLFGLAACLVGNACLALYIEIHRGQQQFFAVSIFTVSANLLQVVTVIGLAVLHVQEPAIYIIVFGFSTLAGIVLVEPSVRTRVRFARRLITRDRVRRVFRFVLPLLVHSGLIMAWGGVDVFFLNAFDGSQAVGEYGAAKTLVNALQLAPLAIATALLPQLARLSGLDLKRAVRRVLVLVIVATVPPVTILIAARYPLLRYVFGPEYVAAAAPLAVLAIGTALYGISMTLEESWIAIGRPRVATALTAVAAVVAVSSAPLLVIRAGSVGAAAAYSLGAVAQLSCSSVLTFRNLHR